MADPSSNISIPITSEPAASAPMAEEDSMEGVEQSAPDAPAADAPFEVVEEEAPVEQIEETEAVEVHKTFVDYLKSPIITIHVGEEPTTLSAHMALLQASPFLARACATYTAETPLNERSIQLPDEDLAAVGSLLEYLYTGEYFPRLIRNGDTTVLEDLPESEASDLDDSGEHLLRHARIYTLGEKLELPKLKELAHSKIHRINSTAKGELRYARFVYKNTSREDKVIRAPIASFWAHRSHVLRHEAEDEFCRMILEFPMFAYDILSIVLDAKEKSKEKRGTGIGPSDEQPLPDTPSQKVPRTGRKRPRNSTTL